MVSDFPQVPNALVPKHIEDFKSYQAGRPPEQLMQELGIKRFVNLASNENPMGPPPSACEAMAKAALACHRYPESGAFHLRDKLAAKYLVGIDNIAVGSGSESIMSNIIRAFLTSKDEVVTSEGTFVGFYVLVNSRGIKLNLVPLKDYCFDLDGIAEAINEKTKIVYLCNPNNPTGTTFSRAQFESFVRRVPEHVLIILDEAYIEYTHAHTDFPDSMSYRFDNVLTLRTFSKAYGMAGIRLGAGMGHDYLIKYINKVKLPFEPSVVAQAAGIAALDDHEYLTQALRNNDIGMKMICEAFDRLGVKYLPSHANFILVPCGSRDRVAYLHESLLRKGIAIRPLTAFGLPDCLRVTTGLPDECEAFIREFEQLVGTTAQVAK
jgi:histidinol-phosphate aminotransferase